MTDRDLRIVSHNVADSATITVSNTAAGLGADWLKTDIKGEVCRILSGTGTITLQWDDPVGVDCVALPAWNGSPSSEIRVRCYFEKTGGNPVFDSGWQWAAPGPQLQDWGFSQNVNDHSGIYGAQSVNEFVDGAAVSAVWVPNISARRVVIDLQDPEREMLDIARVVVGMALGIAGASYGTSATVIDDSMVVRAASGDVRIDQGVRRRAIMLELSHIDPRHRHEVMRIINAGLGKRHFVSGYTAGGAGHAMNQELMMYGVLTTVPVLTHLTYGSDGSQFQFEEW